MYQIDEYYLMHKDVKVAKFEMSNIGTDISVKEVYNYEHMPYGTHTSERLLNEKFTQWKNGRIIPVERPYLMQVYKKTGKSVPEMEILNLGLSMCDCYWFEPVGKDYKWESINFRDNGFGTEIGRMLINATTTTPKSIKTPNITLPGECPKMWSRFNNTNYLIKGCRTYGEKKPEICNDVFASLLAAKLGIDTSGYYLLHSGGNVDFCCTPDFVRNSSTDFVTFSQIANDTDTLGKNGILKFIKDNNLQSFINQLLVIDYLIGNYNRTLDDIGILVDADSMKMIRPAPIFDYEESIDLSLSDEDMQGVFIDNIKEQMKLVTDFSWIDFDTIDSVISDLKRIYCQCGFNKEDTDNIQEYLKSRAIALKKIIPPDQIKKKENNAEKRRRQPKTEIKTPDDSPIRIHITNKDV